MNYIEAVKELTTNPKAVAITFYSISSTKLRRMVLQDRWYKGERYKCLMFNTSGKGNVTEVKANDPAFILREDFSIEYKEEKEYTEEDIQAAFVDGFTSACVSAQIDAAYKKFKAAMQTMLKYRR